jgi:arylsulfatase A-like enzyme
MRTRNVQRRFWNFDWFVAICVLLIVPAALSAAGKDDHPNIILILADDLGYGDLGCYGQKTIKTPQLDRMAAAGLRCTQFYAGCTVCAPSRCSLMTGKHTGHCWVRGNRSPELPLRPEDTTIAESLKRAGYVTGLLGKWGLGEPESTGFPNAKGFDYFFGYGTQVEAHNYYPEFLWLNSGRSPLPGNVVRTPGVASERETYVPDILTREALTFIELYREQPFFLFLSYPLPHANNERGRVEKNGMEVPSNIPYSTERWPMPQRNHAAMITRLDNYVGQVLATVKRLQLSSKTIVIFTSDNGPHKEGGADPEFFQSSGGLRGFKRDLTEGGIRVPFIVQWPDKIRAGRVEKSVAANWDLYPTLAEIAGVAAPKDLDGVSLTATWLEQTQQAPHPPLYWEFHERRFQQAVRVGDWKGIRKIVGSPMEVYDLSRDPHEERNVAPTQREVVKELERVLQTSRSPSKYWPGK